MLTHISKMIWNGCSISTAMPNSRETNDLEGGMGIPTKLLFRGRQVARAVHRRVTGRRGIQVKTSLGYYISTPAELDSSQPHKDRHQHVLPALCLKLFDYHQHIACPILFFFSEITCAGREYQCIVGGCLRSTRASFMYTWPFARPSDAGSATINIHVRALHHDVECGQSKRPKGWAARRRCAPVTRC